MDRRRFFMNRSLNEGLSQDQKTNLFEETFAELNRLYEASSQSTALDEPNEATKTPEAEDNLDNSTEEQV